MYKKCLCSTRLVPKTLVLTRTCFDPLSTLKFAEDAFEKDKILKFLKDNKFPLVTFLTEVNSVKVYDSDKLQVSVTFQASIIIYRVCSDVHIENEHDI